MESIRLDLVPDGAMPELHASQYDKGRRFRLNLLDFGIDYTLDGTETLTVEERKVDGNICVRVVANTFSGKKYVEFTTTEQMCACAGYNLCELHIVKGEDSIGTLNFILNVERSPIEGGLSGSEIENLYTQIDARVDVDVADIMDDYYKKSETYSSEEIDNALDLKANASDVYDKTEIDTALALKANTSDVNTALALKASVSDLNRVSDRVGSYNSLDLFEMGNINITSSGWGYLGSVSRVCTPKGLTLHLKVGDVVGLTDYTNARFYMGWLRANGTYGTKGWNTSNVTITEEGDYVFTLCNRTDTPQTDKTALASLFFGYYGIAFDNITKNIKEIKTLERLIFNVNQGYITSNGNIALPSDTNYEVYSDLIECYNGQKFFAEFSSNENLSAWAACAIYDEKKNFIDRATLWDSFFTYITAEYIVNNANAKYIRFSYRTFNKSNVKNNIYTSDREPSKTQSVVNLQTNVININSNVKSINHRGYNTIAPENTLVAYKLSKKYGFAYVETDVQFTSDGVPVLLHDRTINRTGRNADGSAISSTINIDDITYAEALNYDFGIYKSFLYQGTKIPRFEDFIALCKNIGLSPYIELKSDGVYTEEQIRGLVDIVKQYGMRNHVTWISFSETLLGYVKDYDDTARIGFISNYINNSVITKSLALKTSKNEVFVDGGYSHVDSAAVALCLANDLPIEAWTVNSEDVINNLNPYVSGVTSDSVIASDVLYKYNI